MPLPAAVSTTQVTGRFTNLNGSPAVGRVTFATSVLLRVTGAPDLIVPGSYTALLDANGVFALALPATNDPDITPSGWLYTVTISIAGSHVDSFDCQVPMSAVPLQLRDLTPAVAVAAVSSYILVSQVGAAGGVASLDAGGKVPGGQLPAPATDATLAAKGLVRLAGDLAGTADAPTVPGLAAKVTSAQAAAAAPVQTVAGRAGAVVLAPVDVPGVVAQWQPATNYAASQPVINPTGELVRALAAHLSGAVYNAANWSKPASGTFAALPGTSRHPLTGFFHLDGYGAKGDGAADDAAAINAAVSAAVAAGGGTLYAPPGVYSIAASSNWGTRLSLRGAGIGKTIFQPKATMVGSCFQQGSSVAAPLTDCQFRDFEIDGSLVPTTTLSKGFFFTYMLRARFENVDVHGTTATGFGADFLRDTVYDRCVAEGCGRAAVGAETTTGGCSGFGIGSGASQVENVIVSRCVARNNARYGIFIEFQSGIGTFLSRGAEFVDNYVEGNYYGIGSCGVERSRIARNVVTGATLHGIHIGPSDATHGALSVGDQVLDNIITSCGGRGINIDATTPSNLTPYVGDHRIAGNLCRGNTGVQIKVSASATVTNLQVLNNLVESGGSIGIDFAGGRLNDLVLAGNSVVDNTGDGIRVLTTTLRLRAVSNKCTDTRAAGSKTQTYGLDVASVATDADIRGNDLRGNATAGMNTVGGFAGTSRVEDNPGYNPIGTDTLAVTVSPMTYTVGASRETLYVLGGTWTNVSVNGVNVATTTPNVITCDPGDVVIFTYTAAPVAIKRQRH